MVRLYALNELVALLVIAQLRNQFSLQLIRKIIARLRTKGYKHPLTELRFATVDDEIFFQHPDGTWEGNRQPDQIVLEHVLHLEPLKAKVRRSTHQRRDPSAAGRLERRRRVMGSKPVFTGTRTPVSALYPYLRRGTLPNKFSRRSLTSAQKTLKPRGGNWPRMPHRCDSCSTTTSTPQ